jgi:hypothetical protein
VPAGTVRLGFGALLASSTVQHARLPLSYCLPHPASVTPFGGEVATERALAAGSGREGARA